MLLELAQFLFAFFLLVLPGIALAWHFNIGRTAVDRLAYGSTLGLAMAAYLAFLISQSELAWFYPMWIAVVAVSLILIFIKRAPAESSSTDKLMIPLLLLIGISRIYVALPHLLPPGWDPSFHLLLASKIQETGHAIHDWLPYADATLNYPTGSHTLLVVLARISHLSLPDVFKYFMQLLGVITTAQLFTFARRATGDDRIALFSAAAYGMLAWYGSLNYFGWGGLPNELGMLLLLGALSLWIDDGANCRSAGIAIMLAAVPLVHHHVMLVAVALIVTAYVIAIVTRPRLLRRVLIAPFIALLLTSFFIIPYALKARSITSTSVFTAGEDPMDPKLMPENIGYALTALAAIGFILWIRKPSKIHPLVLSSCGTLLVLFIATDYGWPEWLKMHGQQPSTALTPSRFITDMNYFLPLLAGLAAASFATAVHARTWTVFLFICLLSFTELVHWNQLASTTGDVPIGYVRACDWIARNTPPEAFVLDHHGWACYLTHRRCQAAPLPVSEPVVDNSARLNHVDALIKGNAQPNPDDKMILGIIMPDGPRQLGFPTVFLDPETGVRVVQFWPR